MISSRQPPQPPSSGSDDSILVQRTGPLATVILNRPDKRNALDRAGWERLADVFEALDTDETLRCVLLRGAGDKAFAAGADISAFEQERADAAQARLYGEAVQAAMQAVAGCRHPVIALILGACVGGGLQLASACDLRLCGHSAKFGAPVKRLGLTMAYSELKMILDLIGPANSLELLLEGEMIGAERAARMGLVNRVVDDAEAEAAAHTMAERIAAGAPIAARLHKRFIRRLLDPAPLTPAEQEESWLAMETEDYRIGVAAFLAKTEPDFKGQ